MTKNLSFTLILSLFITHVFAQENDTVNVKQDKSDFPQITVLPQDLESDNQVNDISGLLQSSQDIFVSTAGFTFGQTRFKIRGYDSENTSVLMNGVQLNDLETGGAYWSSWGGLNDVTRNQEIDPGISSSKYAFGEVGGVTNMITRASSFRKQIKLTYSLTNRNYRDRLMFMYSTGLMENGWSIAASASRRWAREGYVEGTFYDAYSYFLAVEKKINTRHSIGLIFYGSPNKHGRNGVSTQEANDLAGTNYYNPYWGFQNGEKRNASISNYHQPMIVLSHYWTMDEKTTLTSSVFYSFGRGGSTAVDWYDAGDPRPDYYRNLPSYDGDNNGLTPAQREDLWINDQSFRQLDFDNFYFVNRKNLYTIYNVDGVQGQNHTGNLSNYVIEDRRNDKSQLGANFNLIRELNEHTTLSGGLDLNCYKSFQYKLVDDLLGGDFYINLDKFAERDLVDPMAAQNDLNHPNQVIYEGDKFGYDYTANINKYDFFVQADFKYSKIDYFVAGQLSYDEFWRTGHMRNGKFPNDSYGDSEKHSFMNYGGKAGATYKITGRHLIDANVMYTTRAPYFRTAYVSPRTRNEVINGLTNEKIMSGDLSYIYRSPLLQARITGYYTKFTDGLYSRSFYHEDLQSFVNYQMVGVDRVHIGTELGVEGKVNANFTLYGVFATGQFYYDSNPTATISVDNNAQVLSNRTDYLKDYYDGGFPQTAASAGVKYYSSINIPSGYFVFSYLKNIFAGVAINYYDDIYVEINPDRRSAEAVANYDSNYPELQNVLNQEKLNASYTLDANVGLLFYFGSRSASINFSMTNILDEQDFAIGGFEQFRYDPLDIEKFPSKYFYLYGRQFFLNLNFRF
jgi:hypothetical protein